MGFQVGSRIRPELGDADVSGFARGGMAIGAGVLQGIQNYQEQKQITSMALSDLEGRMAADPSILPAMQQAGQNNPKIAKALKSLQEGDYKPRDVLALSGCSSALQSQKAAMQANQLREMQLNMASMKANTPPLVSVKEAQNFKEYLGTLGGGKDVILKNGMLYDEDFGTPDDVIPFDDPIVQQVLRTKEGQTFLTGYGDAELISTE